MDDDHMDIDQPLEDLCSKLITTYNTTILDKMDLDMEKALRQEAECETSNKKERTVLKELIRRHYDPNLQRKRQNLLPAYIGGPFNLTCHWSEYYQKLIYIFGEEHSGETDCHEFDETNHPAGTLIENFLKNWIKISDCFLDVLIEFEAYKGYKYNKELSENKDTNRLVKIAKTFSSCINASERDKEENKEECSFSRIHYFDVRSIERDPEEKGPDYVSRFIFEYINITEEYYIDQLTRGQAHYLANKFIQMTKKYEGVMKGFLLKFNDKEYLKFWYGMLSKNHYTKKELEHLGEDKLDQDGISIKTTIESFIKSELLLQLQEEQKDEKTGKCTTCSYLINTLAQSVIDNTKLPYRLTSKDLELVDDLHSLISLIILVNSSVIDAYLLARIFKKFDLNSEKQEKIRSTDEPDEARNIIIYAGNKHCATYRKFLIQIGFESLADIGESELEDGKKPRNCVDIRSKDQVRDTLSFKKWTMQPLFSQWPPEKDPNLDVRVKQVKKSWGCNVMFRSKKPNLKLTENQAYIMNDFGIKRSPNDYYHEYEKSSNPKIVKVKRTSPNLKKESSKGIKKTAGLK